MNEPAKVQVVIPVHNRRETTRTCLAHLASLEVPRWAGVIVVDDGCTDGTAELVTKEFPWVQIIQGDGALWWTGAIVLGMRAAIHHGSDCIIWLNDDTLPDQGTLELLVNEARANQAVCGAVCRGNDGRELAYSGGTMKNHWPRPLRRIEGGTKSLEVEWLHGNLAAIPAFVWQRCGLPDARNLPHNLADISYTYAAHQAGIPVRLLPQASATASINDSPSYWSWLDPRMSAARLLTGLWDKKMWWFAPGVLYFQWHHFSWGALTPLAIHYVKFMVLLLFKIPLTIIPGLRAKSDAG